MMFFWLPLFLVPLVLVWAFHDDVYYGPAGHHHGHGQSQARQWDAVEVARLRLARGEITVEEYDTIRRVLG